MAKNGPIIIIEDDVDDQELLNDILRELKVPNLVKFFNSCVNALQYMVTTVEKPFLIISDINLPAMTGLELCRKISDNESLKVKSIPFIFLTTAGDQRLIQEAYTMFVQGFFVKPTSIQELKAMFKTIIDYWNLSQHPFI